MPLAGFGDFANQIVDGSGGFIELILPVTRLAVGLLGIGRGRSGMTGNVLYGGGQLGHSGGRLRHLIVLLGDDACRLLRHRTELLGGGG